MFTYLNTVKMGITIHYWQPVTKGIIFISTIISGYKLCCELQRAYTSVNTMHWNLACARPLRSSTRVEWSTDPWNFLTLATVLFPHGCSWCTPPNVSHQATRIRTVYSALSRFSNPRVLAISNCITGPFWNKMARNCKPNRDYAVVSLASVLYLARRTHHPRSTSSNPTSRLPCPSLVLFGPQQGLPANFAFAIRPHGHRIRRMEYGVYTRVPQTTRRQRMLSGKFPEKGVGFRRCGGGGFWVLWERSNLSKAIWIYHWHRYISGCSGIWDYRVELTLQAMLAEDVDPCLMTEYAGFH